MDVGARLFNRGDDTAGFNVMLTGLFKRMGELENGRIAAASTVYCAALAHLGEQAQRSEWKQQ
jgi:hypothetical protein